MASLCLGCIFLVLILALAAKYGWQFYMLDFMNRFSRNKTPHVAIEIGAA